MTEDEAKTKWCPFVRMAPLAANQAYPEHVNSTRDQVAAHGACIASACMAWRSKHEWLDNAQQEPSWVSYPPYAFQPGEGQERDNGFCGLAGRPE